MWQKDGLRSVYAVKIIQMHIIETVLLRFPLLLMNILLTSNIQMDG